MTNSENERQPSTEPQIGDGKTLVARPHVQKSSAMAPEQLEVIKTAEAELQESRLQAYEPDASLELSHREEDAAAVFNKLTPEEERVIVHKDTEMPGSGRYDKFFKHGTYACRRCNTPLFKSDAKFDSGCGWPSFDDAIPGRVKEVPDADGRRTEIICAACGAHLGHVFRGEHKTKKDTRHCVNSLSLGFVPAVKGEG